MAEADYLFDMSQEHEKQMRSKNFGQEILEGMSYQEARDLLLPLFETRIKRKKTLEKFYKQTIRKVKKYYASGTFEYDFSVDVFWILYGAKNDIENQSHLHALERFYFWNEARKPHLHTQSNSPKQNYRLLIQTAKEVLIESLYKNPLRKSGSYKLVGLCTIHQERTASFTIYTNTNTFYCYGCHAKGDSISFYQKFYGVSFWEAVKQLASSYSYE